LYRFGVVAITSAIGLLGLMVSSGSANATPPTGPGSASGAATCNVDGTVSIAASATGLVSSTGHNNPDGYYQGGAVVSDGVSKQFTPLTSTDANGNVTFPAFNYDPSGQASATLYVESTTSSGGVNLPFTVSFPTCAPPTGTPTPPPAGSTPTAVISSSPVSDLVVWFNGSGSFGGTPPLSYAWNFGDGTISTDAAPGDHTFPAPGDYTVTLTVTDAADQHNVAELHLKLGPQVTISAAKGVRAGGTERVAIAVTNGDGSAAADTAVVIKVTGADTTSGTVVTNTAGRAIFRYRTHHVGRDKITATAEGVSASTTVSILRPVERPTVRAAFQKGVVNVTVLTSPRIAHHKVFVYRYHKVHGHWRWTRVGVARTASNGRAHLALSLPHGKQRLRAIVSDKHYVERYSKVCLVRV
jgi:hypothetical protein